MAKILFTVLLVFCFGFCQAQDKQDSISRVKADKVLSHFDSLKVCKLLYSISNTFYYVIYKDGSNYRQVCISADSMGGITRQKVMTAKKSDHEILAKAFDVSKYHRNYITSMGNATVIQGNPSYFVFKDAQGNRYGEYSLSILTSPVPIDKDLYIYLITNLVKCSTE